ncbi:MAG: PEGA domain-containing protein [Oligoflexales bacterium]
MKKLFAVLSLIATFGCQKPTTKVNVEITAKDNQGSLLDKASVYFNSTEQGQTTSRGSLKMNFDLLQNEEVTVSVKKESTTHYFAPYYTKFVVINPDKQDVKINAVLYSVPKPSVEETVVEATEITDQAKKTENEAAATEKKVNDAPEISIVQESAPAKDQQAAKLITTTPSEPSAILFTFHTYAGATPVAKVGIYQTGETDSKLICTTNVRGRCSGKLGSNLKETTFVAKKNGFYSQPKTAIPAHLGQMRFQLLKGQTLDISAVSRVFESTRGLKNVSVSINGKLEGVTNDQGKFTYFNTTPENDLIEVSLQASDYLPQTYTTDFVASDSMSLVKYFSPPVAPKPKITLLDTRIAGQYEESVIDYDGFNKTLGDLASKSLRELSAFDYQSSKKFYQILTKEGGKTETILSKGWLKSSLKGYVDAVVLPTVSVGKNPVLELSVVNSNGLVIAAATEKIGNMSTPENLGKAIAQLSDKLANIYPFEGSIVKEDKEKYIINLGSKHDVRITKGDQLTLYGTQTDKLGKNQSYERIGSLKVESVGKSETVTSLTSLNPRSKVAVGDVVVLDRKPTIRKNDKNMAQIKVLGMFSDNSSPIVNASVYSGDRWLGSTDQEGIVLTDPKQIKAGSELKVIKQGYRNYSEKVASLGSLETIKLVRETAFLQIDSAPTGATVRIEGKIVGNTPLNTPIPVPSGFVKLELTDKKGYKPFSQVLELDEGTISLTEKRSIQLEKDYLSGLSDLIAKKAYAQAAKILVKVPENHSDYLQAQHELGNLYLDYLNAPAKAAEAFHNVTKSEEVKNFIDKRFVGSHVNEGIALFKTAQSLEAKDKELAAKHYQKAVEVLDNVIPHLRFVPKEQYLTAVHQTMYHKALGLQKIWELTQDPVHLQLALKSWQGYLESHKGDKADAETSPFIENAKVFYKQAMGSSPKSTEKL